MNVFGIAPVNLVGRDRSIPVQILEIKSPLVLGVQRAGFPLATYTRQVSLLSAQAAAAWDCHEDYIDPLTLHVSMPIMKIVILFQVR